MAGPDRAACRFAPRRTLAHRALRLRPCWASVRPQNEPQSAGEVSLGAIARNHLWRIVDRLRLLGRAVGDGRPMPGRPDAGDRRGDPGRGRRLPPPPVHDDRRRRRDHLPDRRLPARPAGRHRLPDRRRPLGRRRLRRHVRLGPRQRPYRPGLVEGPRRRPRARLQGRRGHRHAGRRPRAPRGRGLHGILSGIAGLDPTDRTVSTPSSPSASAARSSRSSPASAAASSPRVPTSAATSSARSRPASPRTTRGTPQPSPTTSATTSATAPAWPPTSSRPTQ